MLTHNKALELFLYDPETGLFYYRKKTRRSNAGDIVTNVGNHGYLSVGIDYKKYTVHRLIWLYMTGEWPEGVVDHINGIRTDNRWCNLRDVSQRKNCENRNGVQTNSVTGVNGVSFSTVRNRFMTVLHRDGIRHYLGSFRTLEEAVGAKEEFLKNEQNN